MVRLVEGCATPMELRHLRYFGAVAQTCRLGQAAAQLHVAQPALSQALRRLEDESRAVLLKRRTRQVSLTPVGGFLRGATRRLLDGMDDTVQGVQRIAQGSSGIAVVPGVLETLFPQPDPTVAT